MATADEIAAAAATSAEAGISSQSSDGVQTTAMDPLKQMQVADKVAANAAGARTHFGLRFTKLVPPGCG